jgi:hypothetical protein
LMSFSLINFSGLCLIKKKFISKAITVDYTLCQKKKPVDYTQAVDRERTKSSRERENCQTMWERNWIWCGDEILDQVGQFNPMVKLSGTRVRDLMEPSC